MLLFLHPHQSAHRLVPVLQCHPLLRFHPPPVNQHLCLPVLQSVLRHQYLLVLRSQPQSHHQLLSVLPLVKALQFPHQHQYLPAPLNLPRFHPVHQFHPQLQSLHLQVKAHRFPHRQVFHLPLVKALQYHPPLPSRHLPVKVPLSLPAPLFHLQQVLVPLQVCQPVSHLLPAFHPVHLNRRQCHPLLRFHLPPRNLHRYHQVLQLALLLPSRHLQVKARL